VDALDAVQTLLPLNITVFAFDFTGSGLSEGLFKNKTKVNMFH
jgi:hypothetical protein